MNVKIIIGCILGLVIIYILSIVVYRITTKKSLEVASLNPIKIPFFQSGNIKKPTDDKSLDLRNIENNSEGNTDYEVDEFLKTNGNPFYPVRPDLAKHDASDEEQSKIEWTKAKKTERLNLDRTQKFKNINLTKTNEYNLSDGISLFKFEEGIENIKFFIYGKINKLDLVFYDEDGIELMRVARFGNAKWIIVNDQKQYDNVMSPLVLNILSIELLNLASKNCIAFNKKIVDEGIQRPVVYITLETGAKKSIHFQKYLPHE